MLRKLSAKIVSASSYSLDGCKFLLQNEFAARVEIYAYFWMMVILLLLKAPPLSLAGLTILFFILLAVEALNTAIEVIIDRVSPEISQAGKRAKDLGSFAVFCIIMATSIFFAGAIARSKVAGQLWQAIT